MTKFRLPLSTNGCGKYASSSMSPRCLQLGPTPVTCRTGFAASAFIFFHKERWQSGPGTMQSVRQRQWGS